MQTQRYILACLMTLLLISSVSFAVYMDTGILDVYRHSMDLETKAANFYKERAAKSPYPPVKKLWDWLFLFESDHFRMFSETLSYLEKPDLWHIEMERSIFEG